jgi:outer membrane protein insertion porin family/translocation and assembly module TamA
MSDVSPKPGDIRLEYLHMSCGLGARYQTPVGPIRVDVGYRIQPLQKIGPNGYRNEDDLAHAEPLEGVQPKLLGLPIGIAIGIGEAY